MLKRALLIGPLILLAACGGKKADGTDAPNSSSGTAAEATAATEVKASALDNVKAKINCATVKPQQAAEGAPADDVLGVRSGTPFETAKQILSCANPVYAFAENEGAWNRGNDKPTLRYLRVNGDGGLDDVAVDFVGPKGAERAVRVVRQIEYAEGAEQPVDAIKASVQQKYGTFEDLEGHNRTVHRGSIVYSIDGQRLGRNNSDFDRCARNAGYDADSAGLANCGLVVNYVIEANPNDSSMTRKFSVVVFDAMAAQRMMDGIDEERKMEANRGGGSGAPKL